MAGLVRIARFWNCHFPESYHFSRWGECGDSASPVGTDSCLQVGIHLDQPCISQDACIFIRKSHNQKRVILFSNKEKISLSCHGVSIGIQSY